MPVNESADGERKISRRCTTSTPFVKIDGAWRLREVRSPQCTTRSVLASCAARSASASTPWPRQRRGVPARH